MPPLVHRPLRVAALALSLLGPVPLVGAQSAPAEAPTRRLSDAEVVRLLIRESIESYDGNCPCPYHRDRRGRACGRRSAWSREGGEAPYCYPRDVPPEAVAEWRAAHEAR